MLWHPSHRRSERARRATGALLILVSLLMTACSSNPTEEAPEATGYPRTVTDHYGAKYEIKGADRVVAAYGAFSDAVFELGQGERLTGVEQFADWPPGDIDKIPDIGKYSDLNVEGIVSLGADLFIISDRYLALSQQLNVQQLQAAGVSVLVLPEERRAKEEGGYSLAIIEDSVRMIADALAVPAEGERLIAQMREQQQAAQRATEQQCKQWRVLNYRAVASGAFVTGKGSVGELFVKLTGGLDLATAAGLEDFAKPEPEAIRQLRPEVIFGLQQYWAEGKDGVAFHRDRPGLAGTPAAEASRIFPVQNLPSVGTTWRLPGHARELAERLAELEC